MIKKLPSIEGSFFCYDFSFVYFTGTFYPKTISMRKTITFLITVFLVPVLSYAQSTRDNTLPKTYLFEHFVNGSVLSKSGAIDEAPLNYNAEDQSIIF